jgi:hypothetical protein
MKKNLPALFWGVILIVAGGMALAQNQGYLTVDSGIMWSLVFAGISVLSLVMYFASGVRNWYLLFNVGIFSALAFLLWMTDRGVDSAAIVAPLFVGIGLPFVVAFFLDRQKNWWALIPAGVMGFLALVMLSSRPELVGVLVPVAIALAFFVVYFRSPDERFWALIPAGILASVGIVAAFVLLPGVRGLGYDMRLANVLLFLGIAATFLVVWMRHQKRWGLILTVLFAGLALLNGLPGQIQYWPIAAVGVGIYLMFRGLRGKTV